MPCRFLAALFLFALPVLALAQDDGPPIAIMSPDTGSTFVYGTLKSRSLVWIKRDKMLIARVTFTDSGQDSSSQQDDTEDFRLPGVRFDEAKGIFSATTAKGEVIPVAYIKKVLFVKSIEVLPNARVRVRHDHGVVNVTLEAISPSDPAMHAAPPDPDDEHSVDSNKILN
jgi:hypothetical protein